MELVSVLDIKQRQEITFVHPFTHGENERSSNKDKLRSFLKRIFLKTPKPNFSHNIRRIIIEPKSWIFEKLKNIFGKKIFFFRN